MATRDLVALFWQRAEPRISEATDLWMKSEGGDGAALHAFGRLLHTMKGEAHMLGLSSCASLLQAMESFSAHFQANPGTSGDPILDALDAIMMMSSAGDQGVDIAPTLTRLQPGEEQAAPHEDDEPPAVPRPAPVDATKSHDAPAVETQQKAYSLDLPRVSGFVNEARRVHREHALLQPMLREVRRMLRAYFSEIDPRLEPSVLAERVVKTLAYGSEIERKLGDIAAQWSAHDFALEMALEHLEEDVRSAAMMSVAGMRSQVQRIARATARALDKHVDVVLTGDAYVDARIERSLEPALLHLIRNAIDHGIESPEVRRSSGKPVAGHIAIRIEQASASVRVSVEDDGSGIDLERLRTRLGASAEVDDVRLLQRIFDHGVTTRDVVTEVSGRGVGLDVVAREVRAVGGTIAVSSVRGQGARFEIVLPTTLRADVVVPFQLHDARFALPVRQTRAVERIAEVIVAGGTPHLRRGTEDASELVPIYDLAKVLGAPSHPLRSGELAIVVQHREGRFALRVDSYSDPRPMSFEPIDELPLRSELVRGVAAAPDGGVYVLLDVDAVHRVLSPMLGHGTAVSASTRSSVPHVLVVEDAPVARELLMGMLRSFGLRVSDAADGRQGLNAARAERPDLVLSDVEMPFLGGLEMIAEMRSDPQLRDIPVIVLTTRQEKSIRDRAAELGVSGFLSKQRFVEAELRKVIDACLQR